VKLKKLDHKIKINSKFILNKNMRSNILRKIESIRILKEQALDRTLWI